MLVRRGTLVALALRESRVTLVPRGFRELKAIRAKLVRRVKLVALARKERTALKA